MPNAENIIGRGNRFTGENQPKNRGRKPKLYTIAKRTYNVSREEWNDTKLYLLQCPRGELKKISEADDTPAWVVILTRGLLKNMAQGKTDVLADVEDRLFGKAPTNLEISGRGGEPIAVQQMSREEIEAEIEKIRNSRSNR